MGTIALWLLDHLAVVRERGYALDEGEQEVGVRCLAVPVTLKPAMLGISISGPAGRLTDDIVDAALPRLRDITTRLASAVSDVIRL